MDCIGNNDVDDGDNMKIRKIDTRMTYMKCCETFYNNYKNNVRSDKNNLTRLNNFKLSKNL